MGIGLSAPANAIYNMFYSRSLETIVEEGLNDLRYGIRTHYHALNDRHGWGASIDKPESLAAILPVERCARLLNRFNPALPEIRLLVVFGMEAKCNWYPDASQRGAYDYNDKLEVEEKAKALWDAGYLNALVSSDVIAEGKLKIGSDGKPVLNGHTFDAVVYLYPQYAREPVVRFLEAYVAKGGKLMVEGLATHDFEGNRLVERFERILQQATVKGFDPAKIVQLGIKTNRLPDGVRNEDGSYVFTDLESLTGKKLATFKVRFGAAHYSGEYQGLSVIQADEKGALIRFSACGLKELRKKNQVLLRFNQPAMVEIKRMGAHYNVAIVGEVGGIQIEVNNLELAEKE